MSDRLQAAGAAVCMAACTLAWHFLTFSGFNNDHYVHVARGYQMLLGDLPVRDFVDPGEPLMYAVSAGARALFGPALGTEWMVVAGAFAVAAAYTVTAAARLSGSVAVALLIASLQVAISPRSFAYPKILVYAAAALVFMHAAARPTHRRIVALALMTAVAFLFRHDHGLFVGFGALATTVIASYPEGPRIAARRAGLLVLWIGVVLAPWVVFVQTYAGLDSYFASAVGFWRSEMQSAELRTLPGFEVWPFDAFRNALAWLFYLFHLLPLACLALVVRRRRMSVPDRWAGETAVVAGIALMAIPVNVFLIRAGIQIDARIADAFVPAGLLGAWLLAPGAPLQRPRWSLAVMLAVAGTTIAAIATAGDVREQVGRTDAVAGWDAVQERVSEGWASLQSPLPTGSLAPSRFSLAMLPFIKYVTRCTTRQDRLLMTVLYPEVYVMADRGFAGGHQEYRPGFYTNDADQRQMMARLERQSVPFVIMVNDQAAALRTQMPRLDAFVTAHYHPLVFIPVQDTSGVDVFVDSRREVVRRDPETGWPCFVA